MTLKSEAKIIHQQIESYQYCQNMEQNLAILDSQNMTVPENYKECSTKIV